VSNRSKTQFIVDPEFEKRIKNSFYDSYYIGAGSEVKRWRDFGAIEKSKSIVDLCKGLHINTVIEIGCGLCSVTSKLSELNFAPEFYALEVSPSAVNYIRNKVNIPRLKVVYLEDTSKTHFKNNSFDLGILSHVLEHVPNPHILLKEALRISRYVLVEVPLDDCLSANLYSKLNEKITGNPREINSTGHIHFFNKITINDLVHKSGGRVIKERNYRPKRPFYILHPIDLLTYSQSTAFDLIFKITGSKIVGTHHALLITKAADS
jgi:SAM-dependent methyltransferase